jgi:hypothetical protein
MGTKALAAAVLLGAIPRLGALFGRLLVSLTDSV